MAVVGAGPGLGAAVARRFGAEGFSVALVARSREKLDKLAGDLPGVAARGFVADVRDTGALGAALDRAAEELGPVEVLQYSPLPQKEFLRPVLETTVDDLSAAVEFSPGAITPGHPTHDPDVLAERLWRMHTSRGEFRVFAEPLP